MRLFGGTVEVRILAVGSAVEPGGGDIDGCEGGWLDGELGEGGSQVGRGRWCFEEDAGARDRGG
jgi:hypothetical protein